MGERKGVVEMDLETRADALPGPGEAVEVRWGSVWDKARVAPEDAEPAADDDSSSEPGEVLAEFVDSPGRYHWFDAGAWRRPKVKRPRRNAGTAKE